MPILQSGKPIPDSKAVPTQLLVEETWGELWRAQHEQHGSVILVAYTTPKGREVLLESRDGLVVWNKVAGAQVPQLARVLHVSPGEPLPHLLIEDPGGKSLREAAPVLVGDLHAQGAWAYSVAKGLHQAIVYEMAPVGICPDNLIECPGSEDAPWKIVPIAPTSLLGSRTIAGGRYHAKELDTSSKPKEIHADLNALSWLWVELQAGRFDVPREATALKQFVPHKRLATVIANNLQARNGEFADPRLTELGIQRWFKHDLADDLKEQQERLAAQKRSEFQQFVFEHRKWMIQISLSLFILLCLVSSIFIIPKLFTSSGSRNAPYGLMKLYLDEFVRDRDMNGAKTFTIGQAATGTEQMFAEIENMERTGKASRMHSAVPVVRGSGNARTVKVEFTGVNGDKFMISEMNIRKMDNDLWAIEEIYFKSAREYEEEKENLRRAGDD